MVKQIELGKNIVKNFSFNDCKSIIFADDAYKYYYVHLSQGSELEVDELKSLTVVAINSSQDFCSTETFSNGIFIENSILQSENCNFKLKIKSGQSGFLISGTKEASGLKSKIEILSKDQVKKISKPWGYELWLNGEHPNYAFKEIYIKKGTKTSLQYHNKKRETNLLIRGNSFLHYSTNSEISIDKTSDKDIKQFKLSPVTSIDVFPKTIHRLESIDDIILFETSTPHLDDVIRLQDDSKRDHGRIDSEHAN